MVHLHPTEQEQIKKKLLDILQERIAEKERLDYLRRKYEDRNMKAKCTFRFS